MIVKIIQGMAVSDWIIFTVTIIAYLVLWIDIIKNNGRSQNFFTWLLWGILDLILFVTTIKENGSDRALIGGCVVGSFSVAILLLFVKKTKWGRSETNTLWLIIATVAIWLWSDNNLVGIISAVVSEMLAGIPLMRASWKNPGSRLTLTSYLIFIVSYVLSILDAPNFGIENVLFPISFLIYSIGDTIPLVRKWYSILKRYYKMKNA